MQSARLLPWEIMRQTLWVTKRLKHKAEATARAMPETDVIVEEVKVQG